MVKKPCSKCYTSFPLFIVLLVILAVFLFQWWLYSAKPEPFQNDTSKGAPPRSLGNLICMYYHALILAIVGQRDFNYNLAGADEFVQQFPASIPYQELAPYYDQLTQQGITADAILLDPHYGPEKTWRVKNRQGERLHEIMRPLFRPIIQRAIDHFQPTISSPGMPVIHYRCADVPFSRHENYHFQELCFFTDALEAIKQHTGESYDQVLILYYTKHLAQNKEEAACGSYIQILQDYLTEHGYRVTIQSKSIMEDFATMFYAPGVISTSSSFAFFSGYFGQGKYITVSHGIESNQEYCADCGDSVFKGYNIPHATVTDYYDIDAVKARLHTCSRTKGHRDAQGLESFVPSQRLSVDGSTLTGFSYASVVSNMNDKYAGFCTSQRTNWDKKDQMCRQLSPEVCSSVACCSLQGDTGHEQCVAKPYFSSYNV